MNALKTPILFIIFNRPDTTIKVFERIRDARPQQLFIAADGPRPGNPGDVAKCAATKDLVAVIDWPCEVKTLYREQNLGCGLAVSGAINWFFNNVEQGIILEDDTVPDASFFTFCEEMLDKYRHDDRIAHINGSNFQRGKKWGNASYYYSAYPMVWGWASWRRAWSMYDYTMSDYGEQRERKQFWATFKTEKERKYWRHIFDIMYNGFTTAVRKIDTWDYQWQYTFWKNSKIAITPNSNLVTNIGFGEGATHTKAVSMVAHLPVTPLGKMHHPVNFRIYVKADWTLFRTYFDTPVSLMNRIRNISYQLLPDRVLRMIRKYKSKFFAPGAHT